MFEYMFEITIYHWIYQLNGYCSVILLLPFFDNFFFAYSDEPVAGRHVCCLLNQGKYM